MLLARQFLSYDEDKTNEENLSSKIREMKTKLNIGNLSLLAKKVGVFLC